MKQPISTKQTGDIICWKCFSITVWNYKQGMLCSWETEEEMVDADLMESEHIKTGLGLVVEDDTK